jgi:hypothetical protein
VADSIIDHATKAIEVEDIQARLAALEVADVGRAGNEQRGLRSIRSGAVGVDVVIPFSHALDLPELTFTLFKLERPFSPEVTKMYLPSSLQ